MTGWTAETSARAAKPETQIDGHARPDPRGALIIDACMVGEGGSMVRVGWEGARGGRLRWWRAKVQKNTLGNRGARRWRQIQPHDANHHLFSALWDQCMEHGCRHRASNCSVFSSPFLLSDKKAWALTVIPAGLFLPRTIPPQTRLLPDGPTQWFERPPTASLEKKADWCFSCGSALRPGACRQTHKERNTRSGHYECRIRTRKGCSARKGIMMMPCWLLKAQARAVTSGIR